MVRLLGRGSESRGRIIQALQERADRTEEDLEKATGFSGNTVRKTLALLLDSGLATRERRKRTDGQRGAGPHEYRLTTDLTSVDEIEARLGGGPEPRKQKAATERAPAKKPSAASLFVIVKAGTNDAVLTKDGRMLRIEAHALEPTFQQYRRILKGAELEAVALDAYFARFYPELDGKRERPVF